MKEIEVKILEVNPAEIRKKLKSLGAEKFFEGEVHMLSFDFPDERLKKSGSILRVRKAGDRTEVCFKTKNESEKFKVQEEVEVTTSSFEDTCEIFKKLGFKKLYEGKKRRECYRLGKVKFDMDTYRTMPTYLEVEAPTEEEVQQYVEKLGYTMEQTSNLNALQLERWYKSKKQ